MATSEDKIVKLIDGTEIKLRPLKISLLREFLKKFEGVAKVADDNVKTMDLLMECVAIAMKQYNADLADAKTLEENLDLPTVYQIVEVASGINMTDIQVNS